MEASWGPACEFQLANWTAEEPAAAAADVWAPAGLPDPVEHYSWPIDIFDSCSIHAHVPGSRGAEQLVEGFYYYSAASQHDGSSENPAEAIIDVQNRQEVINKNSGKQNLENPKIIVSNDSHARGVFEKVSGDFKDDMELIKEKMHRYPAVLGALDESYTVPRVVAIGPYHHEKPHLKRAEKVKHMAAIQCVRESGHLLEEVYAAVVSVADEARHLYDKDVMVGIGYDDFRHMMFFDACFLVQYMLMRSSTAIHHSLRDFLSPNSKDIRHDVTLLENQIPWKVVETVMVFRPVPLHHFIYIVKGYLQDQKSRKEEFDNVPTLDEDYKPPHLLGLLRYYTVGRSDEDTNTHPAVRPKNRSLSINAIELAKIGITLTANKTKELIQMGLHQEGHLFAELSLAPLSLDRNRASYLVNMAALELCTAKRFVKAPVQDSVVCSYLLLLAMLVYREKDVHELRVRGILQGGGLTNQEALSFFTIFQGMRLGRCYNRVMRDIEGYKESRQLCTKLYAFCYSNKKVIAAVASVIGTVGGIIVTLLSVGKYL